MKQKIGKLSELANEILGEDSEYLIITHKNGKCSAVAHGQTDKIAEAVFSCMHQFSSPLGKPLYHIIKSNALNILRNPSPFTQDLISRIENALPKK